MLAIGAACAASPPDFRSKLLSFFLGGFVDDLPAGVVFASGVLKGGLGILPECVGSRIILSRALAQACPRQRDSEPGITALAQPS